MINVEWGLMREWIWMAVFGHRSAANEDHALRKRWLDFSRQGTYCMIARGRCNIPSHKRQATVVMKGRKYECHTYHSIYFKQPSTACMDVVYQQSIITDPCTRKVIKCNPISNPQRRTQLLPVAAKVIRDAYPEGSPGTVLVCLRIKQ